MCRVLWPQAAKTNSDLSHERKANLESEDCPHWKGIEVECQVSGVSQLSCLKSKSLKHRLYLICLDTAFHLLMVYFKAKLLVKTC